MPGALSMPIGRPWYDWCYSKRTEPHMQGRRIAHPRGKVLGGSSSINGMIFQRGNALDYERWAADPGMQPGTTRTACRISSAWRPAWPARTSGAAGAGRWCSTRGPATNPLFDAFLLRRPSEAGYPRTDDVNGLPAGGFCQVSTGNIHRGRPA
jgi:choline dehydrogenase